MDSGFAQKALEALNSLSDGFNTFVGSTITEAVWNGDAADNAKEQVTGKINPKVEEVKEKLNNLISAMALVEKAQIQKENMAEADRCIAEAQKSGASKEAIDKEVSKLRGERRDFERTYNEVIKQIKAALK